MSLLENKDLLNVLLSIGLNKEAQDSRVNPEAYNAAKTLLSNLKIDLEQAKPKTTKTAPLTTGSGQSINIMTKDLRNLGDLLNWAADNDIKWNGKKFAWKAGESDIPEGMDMYSSFTTERARKENNAPVTITAYADRKALKEFLQHLRDSESNKSNKVFQVMLSNIIGELNTNLKINQEPELEKRPVKQKETIDSQTIENLKERIVDGFSSYILDTNNPTAGISGAPNFPGTQMKLTVNDLLSSSNLMNWFKSHQIQIKNLKGQTSRFDDDQCGGIFVLYRRSQYLANIANQTNDKSYQKAVKYYLEQIKELGPSFQSKDGSTCLTTERVDLKDQSTSSTEKSETSGTSRKPSGSSENAEGDSVYNELVNRVAFLVPLRYDDIDGGRITRFFDAYRKILSNSQEKSAIVNEMNLATTAIRDASNLTINPSSTSFKLNVSPGFWVPRIKEPSLGNFAPFISKLQEAIDSTQEVIRAFKNQYYENISPQAKSLVAAQVGFGKNEPSIFSNNQDSLEELLHKANIRRT